MKTEKICKGVNLLSHKTDKFKTAVISLTVSAPLDNNAGVNALLLRLIARTNKNYPTMLEMNRYLASLYGASISPIIKKSGDIQLLTLCLNVIDDRFTLDGESVSKAGIELLCSCLFEPDVTMSGFDEDNVEREKRLLIEKIESDKDDKRVYSLNQMLHSMCENEAYGLSEYGEIEDIKSITPKQLFEQWKNLILTCPVTVCVIGSSADTAKSVIKPYFERFEKQELCELRTEFITHADEVKTVIEKQHVKQGKLVIGLRAGMTYDMDNFAAIRLMTAIFGGGTFSKLFSNVREKMSLCYYCTARLVSSKGIITIESGVETENMQKALSAIRNELDDMKKGNFSDEVIESAKLSLCDSLNSVTDSNSSILSWFLSYITCGDFKTPGEIAEMIKSVSRE
ncbi:MAG: EF-P 5-aminopentanol modification-associated protein YfmF, partial [Acutalibacteraceae bacterium]